jgi:hypothetical protein
LIRYDLAGIPPVYRAPEKVQVQNARLVKLGNTDH